jgi:hypothetical protein
MARKPGGKKNAITHGAYAKDLLLPDESPEEFERLHRGLIEEWNPTGTLEDDTVLDLAQSIWQKRRSDKARYDALANVRRRGDGFAISKRRHGMGGLSNQTTQQSRDSRAGNPTYLKPSRVVQTVD